MDIMDITRALGASSNCCGESHGEEGTKAQEEGHHAGWQEAEEDVHPDMAAVHLQGTEKGRRAPEEREEGRRAHAGSSGFGTGTLGPLPGVLPVIPPASPSHYTYPFSSSHGLGQESRLGLGSQPLVPWVTEPLPDFEYSSSLGQVKTFSVTPKPPVTSRARDPPLLGLRPP